MKVAESADVHAVPNSDASRASGSTHRLSSTGQSDGDEGTSGPSGAPDEAARRITFGWLHVLFPTIKVRVVSGRYVVGNDHLPSVLVVSFPRARFTYGLVSGNPYDLATYAVKGVIRHLKVRS